jgi:hypothetical protein
MQWERLYGEFGGRLVKSQAQGSNWQPWAALQNRLDTLIEVCMYAREEAKEK